MIEFQSWKIDGSTCEAHFRNATGDVIKSDFADVEKAYWSTMDTGSAVKEGVLAGVTFNEAKKAKSQFPFMTL